LQGSCFILGIDGTLQSNSFIVSLKPLANEKKKQAYFNLLHGPASMFRQHPNSFLFQITTQTLFTFAAHEKERTHQRISTTIKFSAFHQSGL
jgi:hypothetical protein